MTRFETILQLSKFVVAFFIGGAVVYFLYRILEVLTAILNRTVLYA